MKIEIHILQNRCKGCLICIECCQAGVLEISESLNERGVVFPVVAHPDRCIDCAMCEMFCPDFALWITKTEEAVAD